jgi:hypothetical protein
MAYDKETRERARGLYVVDGLTYAQTAEETGVNVTTLKNWGAEENWKSRRSKYTGKVRDIESDFMELLETLLKKAKDSKDPQDVYAAVRLAKITESKKVNESEAPNIDRPKYFLEDLQFVAETLKELDPKGLKVFARNYDEIVSRGKERFAQ